jgi:DNA repair exonuclease SbcCD ATPase subunit
LILRDEALEADKKVALLSEKLNQLKEQEAQVQYQILQHTAGVLALGLHKLEKQKSTQGAGAGGHYVANKESQHTGQVDHEHVDRLQSEIQQMTHSLNALLKRHDQDELNTMPTAELVLDRIEQRLNAYKADTKQLENKVEAAEERIRLENMAGKKMEIQLKAIQDKRDVAQQKIHDLESEIEKLHEAAAQKTSNNTNFDFNLESLQADMNNLNFEDDSNQKMTDLESELDTTVQHLHRVQAELKGGQAELGTLKIMISDLEVASSKAQSQATVYQNREKALKSEMEQYRDEVFGLRSEKEKWEKTMKRQTFMQMMDNNGPSMTEKYEQQLEEQEQEYRAQLKEQAAFLDKTSRQCESLQQEHDKLATTCKDLEDLIRDKTRALDARDVQITRLEQEKKQEMKQEMKHSPVDGATARSMKELQDAFSTKEAQWIEQSAAMEANFEGIMREFDRLTGTAMEFETDKMNYERRIESLTGQVKTLETNLNEEKVKNLGFQGDTPTTASLRREFRKMINDLKADHERVLEREADEKKKLEKQLKDLKHEKDMSRYERVNIGVQTLFMG